MSYNGSDLSPDPLFLQTGSYDARSDRKTTGDEISAGVVGGGDFAVTYSGAGLVMNVAAGAAYIKGSNIADQGSYRQYISAGTTVTCPAADPSNPRIDTIILRVFDNAADSSTFNKARAEVVPGTASAGATLANLTGKNPLTSLTDASLSFIVLAYVLVPAGATNLTSTIVNVREGRIPARIGNSSIYADSYFAIANPSVLRSDANNNAEYYLLGNSPGNNLTLPSNTLFVAGNRFCLDIYGFATVAPSTTPTHRFRYYRNGFAAIDTGAFSIWASSGAPVTVPWKLHIEHIVNVSPTDSFNNPPQYIEDMFMNLEVGDVTGTAITSGYGSIKQSLKYQWSSSALVSSGLNPRPATADVSHQWGTANANNIWHVDNWKAYLL